MRRGMLKWVLISYSGLASILLSSFRLSTNWLYLQNIFFQLFDHCLAPDTMNDGTGMDNMTAVIVKLRPDFDGNKSAKNLLAVEGSSSSSKSALDKTESISSNGDAKTSISVKRTQETNNEESKETIVPCSKKVKLDGEKINEVPSES